MMDFATDPRNQVGKLKMVRGQKVVRTAAMPEPKVNAFSQHIGALCVTRDTNLHKLGAKLGIYPMELLQMINGKVVPTQGSNQRSGEGTRQQCVPPHGVGR